MKKDNTCKMIKTPIHKIPIGIPYKTPEGEYMIQMKKHGKNETESVSLNNLLSMVINEADNSAKVDNPRH